MSHLLHVFIQGHYRRRERQFRLYRLLQELEREAGPAMGKLAAASNRVRAAQVRHDAVADEINAGMEKVEAAEPDAFAMIRSVAASHQETIDDLMEDMRSIQSNFPTPSEKPPGASHAPPQTVTLSSNAPPPPKLDLGPGTPMAVQLPPIAPLPPAPQLNIDRSTGDPKR